MDQIMQVLSIGNILSGLLISAVLAYLLSKINKKLGAWVTVLASFAALAGMYLLKAQIGAVHTLWTLSFTITDYGWFFSVIMLAVFACVSFFNIYWMDKLNHPAAYNALYLIALLGTLGAFMASDFIILFVFWETIVWASMFIIPFGKSRKSAVIYYAFSAFGSLTMLFGIFFLYAKTGTFVIADALALAAKDQTTALVAFFTIGIAGMVKLGVFPFHLWLPRAHGSAPDTFSPILSGGLVKAGGFAALLVVMVMPSGQAFANQLKLNGIPLANYALIALGAVSIVVGTLMAIRQEDFKRLIAYSSVANAGYIIIGIAMGSALSVGGALMHIFAHALASAAAFLAAAAVSYRTGTTKMSELGGMIHRMPITYIVYLMAIISMAGIPPMAGFISKWMIFQSMIKNGMIFVAAAAFFGSIGSFLYVFRPLSAVFLGQLSDKHKTVREAPFFMILPMVLLSLATFLFGVLPNMVLRVFSGIEQSAGMEGLKLAGTQIAGTNGVLDPALVSGMFGFGVVLAAIIFFTHPKSRKVELMDTYTASEFIYTPELLHYSHNFYAPIERIYEKVPSAEKWYSAVLKKIEELGGFATYALYSAKPGTIVMWTAVMIVGLLVWGGLSWI